MSFGAKEPGRKDSEMAKAMKDVAQEPTTRLNVEIPESSMKLLKKIVAEKGVTIREYVNDVFAERMDEDADKLTTPDQARLRATAPTNRARSRTSAGHPLMSRPRAIPGLNTR